MVTEAKRKFGNQELDVLDDIRFLLESQADLMDPAGDETITAARGFSSVKADILDRIRRATERQYKHAGSIFSGDVTITGSASQLISAVEKQIEVTADESINITVLSTAPNVVQIQGSGYTQMYAGGKIKLTGCDVITDDGLYTIANIDEHSLDMYTNIVIEETITGGSITGTANLYSFKNYLVVAAATGLLSGSFFNLVGSDVADGEYMAVSEIAFDDAGITKYYIKTSESVKQCVVFGGMYSVEALDDCDIINPFNSLFTTLHLWDSAGTDIYSGMAHLIVKTAGQFTIPNSAIPLNLHIGDSIHYSIDSHV